MSDWPRSENPVARIWHYTFANYLMSILKEGAIRRATEGVKRSSSRPAVWFTSRETWEPTATRGLLDKQTGETHLASIDEMIAYCGKLCRLEVDPSVASHTWATHRCRHEDPRVADELEADAIARGSNPEDWRVSYHDVPLTKVRRIEVSEDGRNWRHVWDPENGVAPDFRRAT